MTDFTRTVTISVLFFSLVYHNVRATPQMFTESYTFCKYEINGETLKFPDKLWTINTRDSILYFSLCNSLETVCKKQTSACVIHNSQQITDYGNKFIPDDNDLILTSSNGNRCSANPHKNYTLSISLQCSDSVKSKPILTFGEEDCTLEIIMMKPGCVIKCTEIIADSYLLDFRTFKNNIQVESDGKRFSLSLCGSNRQCSSRTTACEITPNGTIPLVDFESQRFVYDAGKNRLTARGRHKEGRIVRDLEVLIKCNWDTEVGDVKYKKPQKQGKHYKFEIESSFGCIKLPQNCVFSSIDHLHFNLTQLYRSEGWEVSNVSEGRILMNMCGPLKQLSGICLSQNSQVCQTNNNKYSNRGSILESLGGHDDVIKATFASGSRCAENITFLYSTEIEFKCSASEKGPVFKEFDTTKCITFIIWETPRACPIDLYKGQNCYINDQNGIRNLQNLHSETDNIFSLDADNKTKLIYNLCGRIHERCNNYENVTFCLKTKQTETVIAFENNELISENGHLKLELRGSLCKNTRNNAEAIVNFICTYENPPPPSEIHILEDSCKYNVTIFTQSACLSRGFFNNCTYSTANLIYDLSPLTQTSQNYKITDGGIDFVFNLCGSIISGPGALCRGDTMVCWNNRTEMNLKHKYLSLGGVARPNLYNNSLVVEAKLGTLCQNFGHYKSVFHFECSKTEFPPTFLSKSECVYNFEWKTPQACPVEKKCIIPCSNDNNTILDLTKLQKRSVEIHIENKTNQYEFQLCADTYVKFTTGQKHTYSMKREYVIHGNDSYLVLDLQNKCVDNTTITKVNFKIECSLETNATFKETSLSSCVLNMTLQTNLVCVSTKENYIPSIKSTTTRQHKKTQPTVVPKVELNCTIMNAYTNYEFSLSKITTQEVRLNKSDFTINLDGNAKNCDGIFCKNGIKKINAVCPRFSFDYNKQLVILEYPGLKNCTKNQLYELIMILRCKEMKSGGNITEDGICKTTVVYDLPEACFLLKQEIVSANHSQAGVIAGSVIGVLLVVISVAILGIVYKRRCRYYLRYFPFYRDKTAVPIYIRDFTQ